ncbi:hypothetical protein DL765_002154 [Monosporascus sp. GIB2]|nr:hypothetical protein DL765_002154 [Monosporascus sp. GIB2]
MTASTDPIQVAFDFAKHEFKDKLKDDAVYDEVLKTTSIEQVYDFTDNLQKQQAEKGHLRHLSKIEPFLNRLEEYSKVIEVFVQAKPDIMALIWGPIKLLLQWASVLKQSFDAIVNTTAAIGNLLPEFISVTRLFSQNTHIKDVLALFFKDILDFYLVALKFFRLPRWRYVFESLWPKYKDKIEGVRQNIERHSHLLRNDVQFEHIRQEREAVLRSEGSHRRQEFWAIKTDISPIDHGKRFDSIKAQRCEGTGKWLLNDEHFAKWLDPSNNQFRLLWLQGIPGAGKTFLSSTVIERAKTCGRALFAFLSYTLSSSTSALSIFHSLIFQLASDDDDLRAIVCESVGEDLRSSTEGAVDIFKQLLAYAGFVYIIIDGLDEIEELERGRLLKYLLGLSKDCEGLKVMISSRNEADILSVLKHESTILRVDHKNAGNIQTFVNQQCQNWFQQCNFFPETETEIRGLLAPLASNSQGMFLYAKVVLSSMRWLDDIEEIRNELAALPESLDDAYGRILSRINNLQPSMVKERARKILGWIGCTPTPMTVQEIHQALKVNLEDWEGKPRVTGRIDLLRLCGPVLEVVDDYVQYIFSPNISGFINRTEVTLGLATTCITYLCQPHHDQDCSDEELQENVLGGFYAFHDYSSHTWFDLVAGCISSEEEKKLIPQLTSPLQFLLERRANNKFSRSKQVPPLPRLECFREACPDVYGMLCNVANFRRLCEGAEHSKSKDTSWINQDPLKISLVSVRIYKFMDELLCRTESHKEMCYCNTIRKYYGRRIFKCSVVDCQFRRHGFDTRSARTKHISSHTRPWKCADPSCEYANGGFVSRKMRDRHLERYHQSKESTKSFTTDSLDDDDIKPLIFDLVRANNVQAVAALLPHFKSKSYDREMVELKLASAAFGSTAMVDLLILKDGEAKTNHLASAAKANNIDVFEYLSTHFVANRYNSIAAIVSAVLSSDSERLFDACQQFLVRCSEAYKNLSALDCFAPTVVRPTAGRPHREVALMRMWDFIISNKLQGKNGLGIGFTSVASTTCSVKLAQYLISHGAHVDSRLSDRYLTPLHHAARQDSYEAAELMRFLLLKGADPHAGAGRSPKKIEDEKGPKNISKWLGKSWDALLAEAKEELGRGNPDDRSGTGSEALPTDTVAYAAEEE